MAPKPRQEKNGLKTEPNQMALSVHEPERTPACDVGDDRRTTQLDPATRPCRTVEAAHNSVVDSCCSSDSACSSNSYCLTSVEEKPKPFKSSIPQAKHTSHKEQSVEPKSKLGMYCRVVLSPICCSSITYSSAQPKQISPAPPLKTRKTKPETISKSLKKSGKCLSHPPTQLSTKQGSCRDTDRNPKSLVVKTDKSPLQPKVTCRGKRPAADKNNDASATPSTQNSQKRPAEIDSTNLQLKKRRLEKGSKSILSGHAPIKFETVEAALTSVVDSCCSSDSACISNSDCLTSVEEKPKPFKSSIPQAKPDVPSVKHNASQSNWIPSSQQNANGTSKDPATKIGEDKPTNEPLLAEFVAKQEIEPSFTEKPKEKMKSGDNKSGTGSSDIKIDTKKGASVEPKSKLGMYCRVVLTPICCSSIIYSSAQPKQISPALPLKTRKAKPETSHPSGQLSTKQGSSRDTDRNPKSLVVKTDKSPLQPKVTCRGKRPAADKNNDASATPSSTKNSQKRPAEIDSTNLQLKKRRLEKGSKSIPSGHALIKFNSSTTKAAEDKKEKKSPTNLQQPRIPQDSAMRSEEHRSLSSPARPRNPAPVQEKPHE